MLFFLLFYFSNLLGDPDNYIPADSLHTPAHIVPEWYFLPFYAILRSIPDKLGGVIAMAGSLVVLFFIPFINTSNIRSSTFRPIFKIFYWLLVADFIIFRLGWSKTCLRKFCFNRSNSYFVLFYFLYYFYRLFRK